MVNMTVRQAHFILRDIVRQCEALESAFNRFSANVVSKPDDDNTGASYLFYAEQAARSLAGTRENMTTTLKELSGMDNDADTGMDSVTMYDGWRATSESALLHLHLLGHHEGNA